MWVWYWEDPPENDWITCYPAWFCIFHCCLSLYIMYVKVLKTLSFLWITGLDARQNRKSVRRDGPLPGASRHRKRAVILLYFCSMAFFTWMESSPNLHQDCFALYHFADDKRGSFKRGAFGLEAGLKQHLHDHDNG